MFGLRVDNTNSLSKLLECCVYGTIPRLSGLEHLFVVVLTIVSSLLILFELSRVLVSQSDQLIDRLRIHLSKQLESSVKSIIYIEMRVARE